MSAQVKEKKLIGFGELFGINLNSIMLSVHFQEQNTSAEGISPAEVSADA